MSRFRWKRLAASARTRQDRKEKTSSELLPSRHVDVLVAVWHELEVDDG